ncbi:MAG: spermidine/putrescine ABC transporter substrate-binding protein [Candidatus Nanopelagicales bacterium]
MSGSRKLRGPSVTRRRVLGTTAAGAAALAAGPLLSACGTKGAPKQSEPPVPDLSDTDKSVNFSNWSLYIDTDDNNASDHPTLTAFTKKTGIAVRYTEDINDADALYAKLLPMMRAGQDTGYDIIVPTEDVATRWIRGGYIEELDKAQLPNVTKNLLSSLQHPEWDKERTYTVPWQSGCTGIAYNGAVTTKVGSITELLTREDLHGKVALLHDWRDTVPLVMLEQGVDLSSYTDDQFMAACAVVQKAVDAGQIRAFTGNNYTELLANKSVYACLAWSGDVVQLQYDEPKMQYQIPEAGQLIWADAMVIPQKAQHRKNAHTLMNYYYEPEVAALVSAYVQYICPVEGAKAVMEKVDPTLVDNPLVFPDAEFLATTHTTRLTDEETQKKYTTAWSKVTGT